MAFNIHDIKKAGKQAQSATAQQSTNSTSEISLDPTKAINETEKINKDAERTAVLTGAPVLKTYPSEVFDIPTGGYFYPETNPLSSGEIELKYMTAREEDILANVGYAKKGIMIDKLLEAVILTPGVNQDDILLTDKNAILLYVRCLAYGDKYESRIKCSACGEEVDFTIPLNFPFKPFDFTNCTKHVNNFEFILPISKKKVTFKLLSGKEDAAVNAELKSLEKLGGPSKHEITTRLIHCITSVDGNTDKPFIRNFVNNMLSQDSFAFRQELRKVTPELNMKFNFVCSKCEHEEEMPLRIEANFLHPDAKL